MNNYSLLLKIAILIYVAYSWLCGPSDHAAILITALLINAAMSFLIPVCGKTQIRTTLIMLSIINICFFSSKFPVLFLMIPILLYELLWPTGIHWAVCFPILLSGIYYAWLHQLEGFFFLMSVFSCILLYASRTEQTCLCGRWQGSCIAGLG